MFCGALDESMIKIARKKKKVRIKIHNLRTWTRDRHRTADDKPYGGGAGMVMKIEPIYRALVSLLGEGRLKRIQRSRSAGKGMRIVLLTPAGKKFTQKSARKLSKAKRLILICGHYEGVDERARFLVTDEMSIGDYILTGGEIPAMVLLDSVARLLPGVLGRDSSLKCETFDDNLLEYPQYTRPREFEGMKVPKVLLSGDHGEISAWRKKESLKKTKKIRRDLL